MKLRNLFLLIILISFSSASCSPSQIDINSAPISELDKIVGIGMSTAQSIIDHRPFVSLDDLLNVAGIGPSKLEDIKTQALACVGIEESVVGEKTESVINLNSEYKNIKHTVIYESKSELVRKYSIYAFSLFLVFIIFVILLKE